MGADTVRIEQVARLDAAARAAATALVDEVRVAVGTRPVSDRMWLDLVHDGPTSAGAVLARTDDGLIGVALLARDGSDDWTVEVVTRPAEADRTELVTALLQGARAHVARAGGGRLTWWVFDADDTSHELAARIGLRADRDLYQMRVPLPLAAATDVSTRPFVPGRDEEAWLEVNNAAFAGHHEQSGWDLATLELREREDWFDPDGFLLHERDGRLAAFCWTKLHRDATPTMGEIYVIAVHPDFHGLGLGRALTVAGLASISARGVTTGMLFVDAHNAPAVGLYRSLGFEVQRTDRAHVGAVAADRPDPSPDPPPDPSSDPSPDSREQP
jgi:mycothiol synthase